MPHKRIASSPKSHGFFAAFEQLLPKAELEQLTQYKTTARGCRPDLSASDLIIGLIFHFMNGAGNFAEHLLCLTGKKWAGSSLAERRAALPWKVFTAIMDRALASLAQEQKQPQSFYHGLRLVALDGTQFSLPNTPQILKHGTKAVARRMRAAFAKMETVVLLEVGLHHPLAAAIAGKLKDKKTKSSEWALALSLLGKIPEKSLLLADRLYGCARFIAELKRVIDGRQSHFLVRARSQLKAKVIKRLPDGSALVQVPLRAAKDKNKIEEQLVMREIRVRVGRRGFRGQEVRLWTSLLDAVKYPAEELVRLYTQRWEQELYYRQMKLELRRGELLQSQTVETAAQEIAALVLATAVLARERMEAAGEQPARKISFVKTLQLLQPLWLVMELGEDILSEQQKQRFVEKFYELMGKMVVEKKRSRSCPRAVRQPVRGWPRKLKNQSHEAPLQYKILNHSR